MDWDTTGIGVEAANAFAAAASRAEDGRKILDEVARLTDYLRKLDGLEDVRVVSCNDSTFRPPEDVVTPGRLKRFLHDLLDDRRAELREAFNARFGAGRK